MNPEQASLHPRSREAGAAWVLAILLLGYVCALLVWDADPGARGVVIRYWHFLVSGFFAVGVPHLIFPDPRLDMVRFLNLSPSRLFRHQLEKLTRPCLAFAFSYFLLAFFDTRQPTGDIDRKLLFLFEGMIFLAGITLFSLVHYCLVGRRSQEWQEGQRGRRYRAMSKETGQGVLMVPLGMLPTLLATASVFLLGAAVIIAAGYALFLAGPAFTWVPALLLLLLALYSVRQSMPEFDRHFYQTQAFYDELFRNPDELRAAQREPLPYQGVYWVPRQLRPHVWAGLLQMDRRQPLGRLMILAHLFLWLLFIQDASTETIRAYLILFIAAKNGTSYLLSTQAFAPLHFQLSMQRPARWIATRFFVNLRWSFPLAASLLLVALFSADVTFTIVAGWMAFDLMLALVSAFFFTYAHEFQFRKRYA